MSNRENHVISGKLVFCFSRQFANVSRRPVKLGVNCYLKTDLVKHKVDNDALKFGTLWNGLERCGTTDQCQLWTRAGRKKEAIQHFRTASVKQKRSNCFYCPL